MTDNARDDLVKVLDDLDEALGVLLLCWDILLGDHVAADLSDGGGTQAEKVKDVSDAAKRVYDLAPRLDRHYDPVNWDAPQHRVRLLMVATARGVRLATPPGLRPDLVDLRDLVRSVCAGLRGNAGTWAEDVGPNLTPTEELALEAVKLNPGKYRTIPEVASAVRREPDSTLGAAMSNLNKRGLIEKVDGRYRPRSKRS